jgi:hypothetical protein
MADTLSVSRSNLDERQKRDCSGRGSDQLFGFDLGDFWGDDPGFELRTA